jgi:hypothetical protein
VRDDQVAAVEDVVADERVEEGRDQVTRLLAALLRQRIELAQAAVEAVSDAHVAAVERTDELHIVVAGNGQRGSMLDHVPGNPDRVEDPRASIDEVADKHDPPPVRMRVDRSALREFTRALLDHCVPELAE